MSKIYIAFYDDEEGGSRENWNTFYTPWVAATTYERAKQLAEEAIVKAAKEYVWYYEKVDLDKVSIDDIEDEKLRETVRSVYNRQISRQLIEIQEGELE